MTSAKNILVTTASLVQGTEIQQHLKPVSAHIVAGTNFFSDVFASFSDVFGGRSKSYQNQLSSLYNEAIEKLKLEAYELGANCIIGLSVDLDEISGKGKSMFMVTAIGSAVIINDINSLGKLNEANEKVENISKIEKGEINIQLGTVMELAKGLNVHPRELFDFKFDLDKEITNIYFSYIIDF